MKRFIVIGFVIWVSLFMPGCKKDSIKGSLPVITLLGKTPVDAGLGYPYTDAGALASDKEDGDITAKIITTNNVNTSVLGTYYVYYNVKDKDGNKAKQVARRVNVIYTK